MTTESGLTETQKRRLLALKAAGLPLLDELDAMVRERVSEAIAECMTRPCTHEETP